VPPSAPPSPVVMSSSSNMTTSWSLSDAVELPIGSVREAYAGAAPAGLEPATRCLEGSRSVQLSYGGQHPEYRASAPKTGAQGTHHGDAGQTRSVAIYEH
jgi:hypothetical protein